jgi:hypothetical protein
VDNNYLDLGINKSGFIHTLPSGRLSRGGRRQEPTAVPHGGTNARGTVAPATVVGHGGRSAVYFQKFVIFLFELGWR